MNKALLLLLVTLVQSQSDGVLLSSTNNNDQVEDVENSDAPYLLEIAPNSHNSSPFRKRALTSDTFTRRSALDKNFMRFGRGDPSCIQGRSDKLNFYRFGRGVKDNFIRFGRGRENFMRFGRSRPEDFFRSGKSLKENFIRFGKSDRNFIRFGRDNADDDNQDDYFSEEPFERTDKSTKDNFMRFGKSGKEGKNGTNFLRFGKSEVGEEAEEDPSKETKRRKREESKTEEVRKSDEKREAGFFDEENENFARDLSPILSGNSWQNLGSLKNSRLTPFFPVSSNLPRKVNHNSQFDSGIPMGTIESTASSVSVLSPPLMFHLLTVLHLNLLLPN